MNLFGWIGVFFLFGGVLFAGAAWSLSRGRRIARVEAKIVAVHTPPEEPEKPQEAEKKAEETEDAASVEYEFTYDGRTERIRVHGVSVREVGESERMYYDTVSGGLYHPRMTASLALAAAAFAVGGIAMIVFRNALMP